MLAKLFGEEPAQQVRDDLRRFKQVMETGEVVRSMAVFKAQDKDHWNSAPRRRRTWRRGDESALLDGKANGRSA